MLNFNVYGQKIKRRQASPPSGFLADTGLAANAGHKQVQATANVGSNSGAETSSTSSYRRSICLAALLPRTTDGRTDRPSNRIDSSFGFACAERPLRRLILAVRTLAGGETAAKQLRVRVL